MLYSILPVKPPRFQPERELPPATRDFNGSAYAPIAGEHLVQYPITQLCSRGCDTDRKAYFYGFGNGNIVNREYNVSRPDTTKSCLKPLAYRENRRPFLTPFGMQV